MPGLSISISILYIFEENHCPILVLKCSACLFVSCYGSEVPILIFYWIVRRLRLSRGSFCLVSSIPSAYKSSLTCDSNALDHFFEVWKAKIQNSPSEFRRHISPRDTNLCVPKVRTQERILRTATRITAYGNACWNGIFGSALGHQNSSQIEFERTLDQATMKSAIFASILATAAAFAPASQKASSTALKAFEDELGAQPPLGLFDPLGLVADGDQEKFERLRYVEIKHGRICMLGVVGYLVQEAGYRLGGNIDMSGTKFSDIPNGFAAFTAIPKGGLLQLLFFIGVLETVIMKDVTGTNEFPGDFRNMNPEGGLDFGWDTFTEEQKLEKRAIELNNGRAAQMGMLALMVHEQLGVSLLPTN